MSLLVSIYLYVALAIFVVGSIRVGKDGPPYFDLGERIVGVVVTTVVWPIAALFVVCFCLGRIMDFASELWKAMRQ